MEKTFQRYHCKALEKIITYSVHLKEYMCLFSQHACYDLNLLVKYVVNGD